MVGETSRLWFKIRFERAGGDPGSEGDGQGERATANREAPATPHPPRPPLPVQYFLTTAKRTS
jgi:hypothetical protein